MRPVIIWVLAYFAGMCLYQACRANAWRREWQRERWLDVFTWLTLRAMYLRGLTDDGRYQMVLPTVVIHRLERDFPHLISTAIANGLMR